VAVVATSPAAASAAAVSAAQARRDLAVNTDTLPDLLCAVENAQPEGAADPRRRELPEQSKPSDDFDVIHP
jgi:hypothetical protein